MRILSRYFVARYLGLFAMVLAVAFLVLATVELVLNLDDVSSPGASQAAGDLRSESALGATPHSQPPQAGAASPSGRASAFLRYLGIRLTSYYLADLLPIASFIAVFLTFALSGRALERLATEAGGIPPIRIVAPVLAAALILSIAAGLLQESVGLRARQINSGELRSEHAQIDFGRKAFWLHRGPTITNVAHADAETRMLHGVEIFERGPGGSIIRVIRADQVQILADGRWQVEAAHVWHFHPNPTQSPRLEEVGRVILDLDSLRGDRLLGADPGLLPIFDLKRYLESDPSLTPSRSRQLQSLYNSRLSRPWQVLIFAWLALPFALRVDGRGRIAGPAVAAVALLGIYFLVETAGETLAQQELIPVGLAPWLCLGVFSLFAAVALPRRG